MAEQQVHSPFTLATYRMIVDPLLGPLRSRIVRLCQDLEVHDVLDIACGTGAQCRRLGQRGLVATGLDHSPQMIALARSQGGRNVDYIQGSAYALPYQDRSFDASLLILALHEHTAAEQSQMLAEARRVCRKFLIVADYQSLPRNAFARRFVGLMESSAGAEHQQGFHAFMSQGGLSGLLVRHHLAPYRQTVSHRGAIGLVAVACSPTTSSFVAHSCTKGY